VHKVTRDLLVLKELRELKEYRELKDHKVLKDSLALKALRVSLALKDYKDQRVHLAVLFKDILFLIKILSMIWVHQNIDLEIYTCQVIHCILAVLRSIVHQTVY
jgi:hypothetical protein